MTVILREGSCGIFEVVFRGSLKIPFVYHIVVYCLPCLFIFPDRSKEVRKIFQLLGSIELVDDFKDGNF